MDNELNIHQRLDSTTLPRVDGSFAEQQKVTTPEEDKSNGNIVSSIFRQSSYLDDLYRFNVDKEKIFSLSMNTQEDGYSRTNEDVVTLNRELQPTEHEAEMLAQAKSYNAYNLIYNSIKKDREDYKEIGKYSAWVTVPSMMLTGAATDPIGLITGTTVGKIAAGSLLAVKNAKIAEEALRARSVISRGLSTTAKTKPSVINDILLGSANVASRVSPKSATATSNEALGVSMVAGASGGLSSEYTLQQANTQMSSEGLYLSAAASGVLAGLITGASLKVAGKNRSDFFENLNKEALVKTSAEDIGKDIPTPYEKFLGAISLGGTNKMAVSNSEAVRTHAYNVGDVSIVRNGEVIGNDSAIDIKVRESGEGIHTAMKIGEIDAKRPDLDVDGNALHEMYKIEAEYAKEKEKVFAQRRKQKADNSFNESFKKIDAEIKRIHEEADKEMQNGLQSKEKELLEKAKKRGKDKVAKTKKDIADIKRIEKKAQRLKKKATDDFNKKMKELEKDRAKALKSTDQTQDDIDSIREYVGSDWLKKRIESIVDEDVRNAVKIANNFFIQSGKTLKEIKYNGMEDIDTNFYVTHRYDPSKMSADIEGANQALYLALKDMTNGEVDSNKLMEYAKSQIRRIIENEKFNDVLDPDTKAMKELRTILPSGSVFAGRKMRINAYYMKDFMRDGITEVIQDYGHKTSGKIAMKKTFNIDSSESKNAYLRKFIDASPSEIKHIKHSLDSIDGSVDIDPYRGSIMSKGARFLTNLSYINLGGFFGLNTLSELGTVIMFDGIRAFRHMVPALKQSISEAKHSPEMKSDLVRMRIAIDRVVNERVNLFADPSLADNSGKVDKFMTTASNKVAKYSGLTMITDVLDTLSALTFVAKVMSPKLSKGHLSGLKLAGLSEKDISLLQKTEWVHRENGVISDFDLSKIKDKDLRWKVQRATARNVRATVLKGDSVQLPPWMVKIQGGTALPRLLFQFMRFPAIAHDRITIRYMSNPRIVNGLVGTATSGMLLYALQELKQMERKKKLSDMQMAGQVASRMPSLSGFGLMTQLYDNMDRGGFTGIMGVGASRLDQGINTAFKLKDGKKINSYDQQYLQSLIIPYSFLGTKTLSRELGTLDE